MDRLIEGVPGMESFLRCRDLPSLCRVRDTSDPYLELVSQVTHQSLRARGIIFNTFEDLDGPILSRIRINVYAVGPLHQLLNVKRAEKKYTNDGQLSRSPNSLFDVDKSCMAWLDSQAPNSVLYVSFGSVVVMTKAEVMEFWHGLVDSKKHFLWAIRTDLLVNGDNSINRQIPAGLAEATAERGCIVGWVPQEEVLSHRAVGGFLTHSGWNSTLESLVAKVPMICWPYFADQQINSRYVGEIWKLGIDMKDVCDRKVVQKMVNDLMVDRREEYLRSIAEMCELAKESVSEKGLSYCNLDRLIEDIRSMKK